MPLNETLKLGFYQKEKIEATNKKELLKKLLKTDLGFHNNRTNYGTHKLHSFPAKFPPQLPATFIDHLTDAEQTVLDPMMGSGTTIIESIKKGRNVIGVDLDPLAILMVKVKTQNYDKAELTYIGKKVLKESYHLFDKHKSRVKEIYESRFSKKSRRFIEYWFSEEKIMELTSLISAIEKIEHDNIKDFLKLVFSSTIITKTGGVSLAIDLAHTRPHRAKKVLDKDNTVLFENNLSKYSAKRQEILTKKLRSAFKLFRIKLKENTQAVFENRSQLSQIYQADAQNLPIEDSKIDLIVTSPPYAANAIDYMRAHKFSLVWFGYEIDQLSKIRRGYIGGESISQFTFNKMPLIVQEKLLELKETDKKRSQVLHRYFTEMHKTLTEMYRVLKPNSAAILVVGNSNLKNTNTELQKCLPEIGKKVGFDIPAIGIRNLDRDKRMLPTGFEINNASQIEKRMHLEYVIGFFKD
jgi:DNA modification methylase